MEFTNSFTVDAPIDQVWTVVVDPQQVTPCVPGAQITEVIDASHFKGTVKVKLGAVQMTYRGEMEMHPDEATHSIALTGKGTDARGGGGASGQVSVQLESTGAGTHVTIVSKVDVTGRVAQFGRGIMQDVSNRLIKEFARCLESKLSTSAAPPADLSESALPTRAEMDQPPAPVPETPAVVTSSAPPMPLPPAPPQPSPSDWGGELRLSELVLDITRSRLAAGLRFLAAKIEPK